jgi:hypothetical protein
MLKAIEKLTRSPLTPYNDHPYHSSSLGALSAGKSAMPSNGRRRFASRRRFGRRR